MKTNQLKETAARIVNAFRDVHHAEADLFNKKQSTQAIVNSAWESAKNEGVSVDQFRAAVNKAFNECPTYIAREGDDAKAIKAAKAQAQARIGMAMTRAFRKTGDAEKPAPAADKTAPAARTITLDRMAEIGKAVGLSKETIKAMTVLALGA